MAPKKSKQDIISSDSESSDGEGSDEGGIRINQKFASEYEKKKRYEELTKYKKHDDDDSNSDDSSSSESEDEDGVLLTDNLNLKILRTVNALRNKNDNPEIYDSNVKFFHEDDVNVDALKSKSRKGDAPKHYKDVVREQIMQQMEGGDGDDMDEEDYDDKKKRFGNDSFPSASALEYDEEQRKLRAEFRKQHNDSGESSDDNGDDDDDDLLQLKSSTPADVSSDLVDEATLEKEIELFGKRKIDANNKDDNKSGEEDNLVDPRGEVEDGHKFLQDFILKKQWIDKTAKTALVPSASDDVERDFFGDEVDEDMEEVDKMDAFESKYNFRFEEGLESAPQIVSYARGAAHGAHDDSLRRKDETRKKRRLERQERKARERKAKEEKLRRLKNAKREEMQSKISAIEEASSMGAHFDEETLEKLLQEDFDADKFNSLMESAYGDDYYGQNDGEWKTDADVKQGLKEEIDTGAIDYDGEEEEKDEDEWGGNSQGNKGEPLDEDEYADDQAGGYDYTYDEDNGGDDHAGKESKLSKELKAKMMDELYKLDYEDIIGDMPCRFKYKEVERNAFGLTPEEILFAKDSTLNQFVGLKKLVPYREEGEYVPGYKRRYKFRQDAKADYDEIAANAEKTNEIGANETNEDLEEEPAKKKRRRQKKGKKGDKKTVSEDNLANEDTNVGENDAAKLKKKRRKEQSKKGEKQSEEDVVAEESLESTMASDTKNKKKKRKRHKKEKTSIVEGMSESRFDSYGF